VREHDQWAIVPGYDDMMPVPHVHRRIMPPRTPQATAASSGSCCSMLPQIAMATDHDAYRAG
jgi:hypothetical protein